MSDDEYKLFNFDDFTEEDFACFDALKAHPSATVDSISPSSMPDVPIEVERPAADTRPPLDAETNTDPSPFRRFRYRSGTLSVTDLVSPLWCEVQFDYGLQQRRSRRLENRLTSFVSRAGKEITVKTEVAAQNDRSMKRGESVHKALETEIHGEEVRVHVTTDEERWGLRLVNLLSSVQCLVTLGCAREVPVFGVIHDQIVIGIIDEISRKPILSDRSTKLSPISDGSKPKRIGRNSSPSPSPLATLFPTLPETQETAHQRQFIPLSEPMKPPTHTLHLIDTKTRRSFGLPSHDDTLSSRLQLMLYYRLLSDLISVSTPFDFATLWNKANVESDKPFSLQFTLQSGLAGTDADDPSKGLCLNDLTRIWSDLIGTLGVQGIDRTLELIYRTQPKGIEKWSGRKGQRPCQEERDLAEAIAASLKHVGDKDPEGLANQDIPEDLAVRNKNPEMDWYLEQSLSMYATESKEKGEAAEVGAESINGGPYVSPSENVSLKDNMDSSKIIGTMKFSMDERFMNHHVIDILEWWLGNREPRGVAVEHSGRCFTCEYCDGCEWREARAMEATSRLNLIKNRP